MPACDGLLLQIKGLGAAIKDIFTMANLLSFYLIWIVLRLKGGETHERSVCQAMFEFAHNSHFEGITSHNSY